MSRVGKHPVLIPSGVTVAVDGQRVRAEGKLGALDRTLMREVRITREDWQDLGQAARRLAARANDVGNGAHARRQPGRGREPGLFAQAGDHRRRLSRPGSGEHTWSCSWATATTCSIRLPRASRSSARTRRTSSISGANKELVGQVASEIRRSARSSLQGQGHQVRQRVRAAQRGQEEVAMATATELFERRKRRNRYRLRHVSGGTSAAVGVPVEQAHLRSGHRRSGGPDAGFRLQPGGGCAPPAWRGARRWLRRSAR